MTCLIIDDELLAQGVKWALRLPNKLPGAACVNLTVQLEAFSVLSKQESRPYFSWICKCSEIGGLEFIGLLKNPL